MRDLRFRAFPGFLNQHAHFFFAAILAALAVGCLAGLWRIAVALNLHVPLDPNEGWNAYHTASTMAGHSPYPAAASFMTNNYPPLSFYLVGLLGTVLGDNIIAGRIVSLISFLAVAGGIASLARRFGTRNSNAAFASLLFAGLLLAFSDYVGMDDPQMLGHALQISGLLLLVKDEKSLPADLASATLFVAGLFVKHNLVAMPIAAIAWLSLGDWRRAIRIAAFMLVLGLAGLSACRFAFGFNLLSRLNSPRTYSFALFMENFRGWLIPAALPLTATLAAGTSRDRFAVFCTTYALIGIVIGGAFLGGAGVDANAMFDADIAVSLGAGMALSYMGANLRERSALLHAVLASVLVLPLGLGLAQAFDSSWLEQDFWLRPMRDDAETARVDVAYLRAHTGPALCETLSLCYWAGKPAAADVFNLNQQYLTGARDERPLLRMLETHSFAVIQFEAQSSIPFPKDVRVAIARNYRVDKTSDDGVFMVPKDTN